MSANLILTVLVLVAGFYMAWNIGANDVSNAMGTSVGSGALTLGKAVVIAGVLEFCGAFFLGGNVSNTMQQGIINPQFFKHSPQTLLYGMVSALIATAIWLQIASYFGWPVSTTHAIVGALTGFGALVSGVHTVHWMEVGKIALSWLISPALSALFAYSIFSVLQKRVLFVMNPIHATKQLIPVLFFIVLFVFTLTLLFNGVGSWHLKLSLLTIIGVGIGVGSVGGVISMVFLRKVRPVQRETISSSISQQLHYLDKATGHLRRLRLSSKKFQREEVDHILQHVEEYKEEVKEHSTTVYAEKSNYQVVEKMFASLQILSASYVAFAHGANDVANAIGPVAGAMSILREGAPSLSATIPIYLLAMGGVGIVVGLATWGWRVIETIGKKITELTPTRGFSAEFGAAVTILVASKLGLPISTTHCIVGAVLGVGLARGISALNLRTLRDIVLSWIITLPASAIVCILIFYLVCAIFS